MSLSSQQSAEIGSSSDMTQPALSPQEQLMKMVRESSLAVLQIGVRATDEYLSGLSDLPPETRPEYLGAIARRNATESALEQWEKSIN